ncbi:hypothetical protein B0H13DRAFT_2656860 [Mycena leptocephala]|nr:hypothetical protein B0H13DRAFT_2656860 [Mycena leptocephala]
MRRKNLCAPKFQACVSRGIVADIPVHQALRTTANPAPLLIAELLRVYGSLLALNAMLTIVGHHNVAYHRCIGVDNSTDVLLTERNFPDLDRLLFAHELLNNSAIVDEIGPLDDLLSELGLVAIPVHQVLQRQWFWRALDKVLNVEDVAACRQITTSDSIYVPLAKLNDRNLILTLTIDVLLLTFSSCPAPFQALRPGDRSAWTPAVSKTLQAWLANGTPLYAVRCSGPNARFTPPFVFISDKVKNNGGRLKLRDHRCAACKDEHTDGKACTRRTFHRVKTLFDLPTHFARQAWYNLRLGLERPETRASKRGKR